MERGLNLEGSRFAQVLDEVGDIDRRVPNGVPLGLRFESPLDYTKHRALLSALSDGFAQFEVVEALLTLPDRGAVAMNRNSFVADSGGPADDGLTGSIADRHPTDRALLLEVGGDIDDRREVDGRHVARLGREDLPGMDSGSKL